MSRVSFLGLCLAAGACARTESVYVPRAVLAEPSLAPPASTGSREAFDYLRRRDRLAPGAGTAVVYHWYHPGAFFVVDDERLAPDPGVETRRGRGRRRSGRPVPAQPATSSVPTYRRCS